MDKPIIFSTEMVKAILDGRKTQTRRVVKSRTHYFQVCWRKQNPQVKWVVQADENEMMLEKNIEPPYTIGDELWVRETWCEFPKGKYHYRADWWADNDNEYFEAVADTKWRPSIFMPKAAARLHLKVTDVRVERLREISEEDAKAEGIVTTDNYCNASKYGHRDNDDYLITNPITFFAGYWDSLNAKRGYGWDTNPYVWVITFERVSDNG